MHFARPLLAVLLSAIVSAPAQAQNCARNDVKIIDGAPADVRDWPGVVALRVSSTASQTHSYSCGGAVIAER